MDSRKQIRFLVNSPNRVPLLRALHNQPVRQPEIANRFDPARSTVHRNYGVFIELGWVQEIEGQYHITPVGGRVLHQYDIFNRTIQYTSKYKTFLNKLGKIGSTFPLTEFAIATVTRITSEDPHKALARFSEILAESSTDHFQGLTRTFSPLIKEAGQRCLDNNTSIELIIDESVLNTLRSSYPDVLACGSTHENFELLFYPDELNFGLAVLNKRVFIFAYDKYGHLCMTLEGTSDRLLNCAVEIFKTHRKNSIHTSTLIASNLHQ